MALRPEERLIYHITDIENLPGIMAEGGLLSDAVMSERVSYATGLGAAWAVSDGNAGAFHTTFESTLEAIDALDWKAIEATYWAEDRHQKAAEFLVADFFPWSGFHEIACQNPTRADQVTALMARQNHHPKVSVRSAWYY